MRRLLCCCGLLGCTYHHIQFEVFLVHSHFAMLQRDGENSLMAVGDAIVWDVFNVQHPEWRMTYDGDGKEGIATRFSILQELADTGMKILSYHNDFPGLGNIFRQGSGYGFKPSRYQFF